MKNIIKTLVLIGCCTFIVACENNRLPDFESHVNQIIEKDKIHGEIRLTMDTINSFQWDHLMIVGPYVDLKNVSEKEGLDLDRIPNFTKDHDRFILMVFLNDKEGIKWIQLKRSNLIEKLLRGGGMGYRVYPKAQSDFILKKTE